MSDQTNSAGMSKLVYVVIALVAIIGLLAGLLVSKATTSEPALSTNQTQIGTSPNSVPGQRRTAQNADPYQDDVRRIVRNMPRERRREILQRAMKNVENLGYESPKALRQKRQNARRRSFEIARTEPFDVDAMRKAIADVNEINQKLVDQGVELTIEVLQLMTPEERKTASERGLSRREQRRERRNRD